MAEKTVKKENYMKNMPMKPMMSESEMRGMMNKMKSMVSMMEGKMGKGMDKDMGKMKKKGM